MFGWLKKLKKNKSHDGPVDGVAEDALESCMAQRLAEQYPERCVAAKVCSNRSEEPTRATIAFVKGSSESKVQIERSKDTVTRSLYPSSDLIPFEKDESKVQIERSSGRHQPRIDAKKLSGPKTYQELVESIATKNTVTRSLYPSSDLIPFKKDESKVKRKAPEVKQEEKTIHDIAKEIPFAIEPRLHATSKTENKFDLLNRSAQPRVQLIKKIVKRLIDSRSQYEYDFITELTVRTIYSHVKVYKTLHSFNDVKKEVHEMANKPLEYKASNDSKTDPLFQNYYQKFRCYKGKRGDIIECD